MLYGRFSHEKFIADDDAKSGNEGVEEIRITPVKRVFESRTQIDSA